MKKYSKFEQAEHRAQLVAALLQNEDRQCTGKHAMYRSDGTLNFCAIGLGLSLMPGVVMNAIPRQVENEYVSGFPIVKIDGQDSTSNVPKEFIEYYGFNLSFWFSVFEANDRGASFHQIAEQIAQKLP